MLQKIDYECNKILVNGLQLFFNARVIKIVHGIRLNILLRIVYRVKE